MAPTYVVRIIKFKCVDESGLDFFGSDEPFWIFTARDPNGKVSTTNSKEFSNVDSGDQEKFPTDNNRNVIWPRKGDTAGAPGPIALSIQLYEKDQGDPADVAKKTQQAFDLAAQAPVVGQWVRLVPSVVKDKLGDLIADDLMGSKTLLFPASRLARQLPSPGSKRVETHRFGGNSGDLPFEISGGPDYDLTIVLARVS
jgi:hypothetical protein